MLEFDAAAVPYGSRLGVRRRNVTRGGERTRSLAHVVYRPVGQIINRLPEMNSGFAPRSQARTGNASAGAVAYRTAQKNKLSKNTKTA
jgi:hypothetical protein